MLGLADVYSKLRKACDEAGSQTAWAERAGFSTSYVCDVLNARRDPGERLLAALGLQKVVAYKQRDDA